PTPAQANSIRFNNVHHVMQTRMDGGAIYLLSTQPGTIVYGNRVHDDGNFPGGIYLDEGTAGVEVSNNLIVNVPYPLLLNNLFQNRDQTCNLHDNALADNGSTTAPWASAGLEAAYRDLLTP